MQSLQPQALVSVLNSASTLQSSEAREKWENSQLNTGIIVINHSSRPLERCPAQTPTYTCVFEGFYLDRSLIGSFPTKLNEGRHRELLPQHFSAGCCSSPSLRALESFKGIKERESTDMMQNSKACQISVAQRLCCCPASTADHGTACVRLSPRSSFGPTSPVALRAILIHSSS